MNKKYIQQLNKKHLAKKDKTYRFLYGLSSRLVKIKNCIMYLEIMFDHRWEKNYNDTVVEISTCWKNEHADLEHVFGCKVYIIDARTYPYKKDLYLSTGTTSYDAKKGMLFTEQHLN